MRHHGQLDDGRKYAFTDHALSRMVEMRVCAPQVCGVLMDPEEKFPSKSYAGAVNYRVGDLTLGVVEEDDLLVVVTALYSNDDAWREAFAKGRAGGDRTYRPGQQLGGRR